MHKPSSETLTLDMEQRERAIELLKRADGGDIQSPVDVVDSWETPDSSINRDQKEGKFPQYEEFIAPEKIAGSLNMTN